MATLYRVRQFLRMAGLLGDRTAAHVGREVLALLSPVEQGLFSRLSAADRRHSIELAARLHRDGHTDPLLLRAALLHDVGKAEAKLRLWHRVLVVLANRFAPRLAVWLAVSPVGWRRPFFVARHHAAIGAELLEQVGSPAEVVWLVRHHERPGDHPLGKLLYVYDSTA